MASEWESLIDGARDLDRGVVGDGGQLGLEVAVGGAEEPHVDRRVPGSADAPDGALLDRLQHEAREILGITGDRPRHRQFLQRAAAETTVSCDLRRD